MLDPLVRPVINRPLNEIGRRLAARGVTADSLTFVGFGTGIVAMLALMAEFYAVAAMLIVLNRLLDGLDGAVARHTRLTDVGGYYDIVLDFIIYSGLVFAFAVGRPDQALAAAFLIFSFVGTGTSFLAYAILAEKHGVSTERHGPKSLYYIGGLAEGTETFIVLVLMCLLPDLFTWIAIVFGVMCWLTTLGRILQARRTFQPEPPAQNAL